MITIVSKDRNTVLNFDNGITLCVYETDIYAEAVNGQVVYLGRYESEKRAEEVFQQLLQVCFPPDVAIFKNMTISEECNLKKRLEESPIVLMAATPDGVPDVQTLRGGVYYMPEE